jgi:hypothetical protein
MLERVVALAVVATAGVYLTQALALPYGTTARPGAGFFPTIVALFACAVGLVMTAQAFLADPAGGAPRETEPARAPHRGHVCTTVVLLVAFCLLLPWVGYPVVAFALVAVLLHRLGSGWRSALAIGGLTALASHYLFAVLLDVPLPRGPW